MDRELVQYLDPVGIDRELVKRDGGYYHFFKRAWHTCNPGVELIDEPHLKFMCDHMEALMKGRNPTGRLLINVPPAHTKSMVCVVLSLPYLWTIDPSAYSIFAHYSEKIGSKQARLTRQVVNSPWYQERWDIQIPDDAKRIGLFSNNHGGGRHMVTVRQPITGDHAKGKYGGLIVVDDPNMPTDTPQEAAKVREWYGTVLPTRFAPGVQDQICIVQQRVDAGDLSAYVLDGEEGYEHVCLPLEFDPERKCQTALGEDWRTEEGEILAPRAYPREKIELRRQAMGDPRIFQAQYNQDPVIRDGNIFLVEHFEHRYDQLPESVHYTISCDLTFTGAQSSDFAVCQVWARGVADGKHYLADQVRRKMGFVESVGAIQRLLEVYPSASVLIEKSANGFATIELLRGAGVMNVHQFSVGRNSKQQRASTISYLFDRGDVLFPSAEPPWFAEYQRELTGFPGGSRHDDCVDATTNYLSWATGEAPVDLQAAFTFAGEFASSLSGFR